MEYSREVYVKRLIERKENGLIKVITGSRRAGKSYLMSFITNICLIQVFQVTISYALHLIQMKT